MLTLPIFGNSHLGTGGNFQVSCFFAMALYLLRRFTHAISQRTKISVLFPPSSGIKILNHAIAPTFIMKQKIKSILSEVKENPELAVSLSDEADIVNEVGLDSLQLVTFLFRLEEAFGIEIDFENFDYSDLSSINCLAKVLAAHTSVVPA